MSRTLPFGFDLSERQELLAPAVEIGYSARYLGRPVLAAGGSADDLVATAHAGLVVRGTELIQLQSRGTFVEVQARDATTLAVVRAWTNVATAGVSNAPVGLTL